MANTARITFDRCEFAHLGANALDIAHGAHDNLVQDCLFRDISAAAVQIGRSDGLTAKLTDVSAQDIGNTVSNSIISHPAAEFHGSVGNQSVTQSQRTSRTTMFSTARTDQSPSDGESRLAVCASSTRWHV